MPFAFLLPWATFHRITQSLLEGTPLVIRFLLAIPGAISYLLEVSLILATLTQAPPPKKKINTVALGDVHSANVLCCDKRNDCHWRQLEKEMRNLFSRAQIILLSLPGNQQVPAADVRWRIAWYHRRDCDPHYTRAVPLSFIACSCLPLPPKVRG